jgi:hypothetical protein
LGDVFLPGVVDLFGDPVPRSRGKRGRPPHVPSTESRHFVTIALVCGRSDAEIAAALRITERTLQRHYFHELGDRHTARMKTEMKLWAHIVKGVEAGSVAAMALLSKKLERVEHQELAQRAAHTPKRAAAEKPGKKASRQAAAEGIAGLYQPRTPPKDLVN